MQHKIFLSLIICWDLGISSLALAANDAWLEKSIEVQVEEKNPNTAQRMLLEQATERVSLDIISFRCIFAVHRNKNVQTRRRKRV